jgi:hypothetical protein
MTNVQSTLEQRGTRYGQFIGQAEVTQDFKRLLQNHLARRSYKVLPDIQQEALDMIFSKIARIINGDNNYDDSWHDIAGYASLVVKDLNGEGT